MNIKESKPDDFSEIYLIPYMHTDYSWTNARKWHIWRYIYGFKRALEIMREDPTYTFVLDNVHHSWLVFEKYCPELIDEFRLRVEEGRFIVANGGYALARPNYSGDEAYVRNVIEGERYFKNKFNIPKAESHFFFNADTCIGHSQIPQILNLTGNKYYRSLRPSETMTHKGIPRQFIWKGLDGSEIIVARGDYGGLFLTDYFEKYKDLEKDWDKILESFWNTESKNASNSVSDKLMLFFGCDDVIPGCNLIDKPVPYKQFMDAWNRHQNCKIMFSTPGRYFAALEKERDMLPVIESVLDNCELSYNTPHKGKKSMWYRRRILERLIIRLENVRSILHAVGMSVDSSDIKELWEALFSILGHAIEFVLVGDIEKLESIADEAILKCRRLIEETEEKISEMIEDHSDVDKGITEYTVINPIPEEREEIVKLSVTTLHGLKGLVLTDSYGNVLPYQVTEMYIADKAYECECNSVDLLTKVKIPACGWNTIIAGPGNEKILYKETNLDYYEYSLRLNKENYPVLIDTGAVKATFQNGMLIRIEYQNRTINGNLGQIKFSEFRPKSSGWAEMWGNCSDFVFEPEEWGLVKNGDLRWIYRTKGKIRTATATVDIILEKDSPRIDYKVTLDCDRNEGIFTVSFPCDCDTELYADIPYGIEHRDLSSEPSAEQQADLGNPDHYFLWEATWRGQFYARNFALFEKNGLDTAIISDTCSIYYSLRRDLGTVSLLLHAQLDLVEKSDKRGENWVKLCSPYYMGLGKNTFEFSYCPFEKAEKEELFYRVARETKLIHYKPSAVSKFGFAQKKGIPWAGSVLTHSGSNVIITANYYENDENIIRGYDASGRGGTVSLKIMNGFTSAYKSDLLGNKINGEVKIEGDKIIFKIRKWEIFTIHLK